MIVHELTMEVTFENFYLFNIGWARLIERDKEEKGETRKQNEKIGKISREMEEIAETRQEMQRKGIKAVHLAQEQILESVLHTDFVWSIS